MSDIEKAIENAVKAALKSIGLAGLKSTSLFKSSEIKTKKKAA